jgi:dihydrolipoamide dehydrogenase
MAEEFDVVVIGSGPGGYVAAIRAAQLKLKTACVEKGDLGGTCLNVGCIPSKALLHSTEFYAKCTHDAPSYGISIGELTCDFPKMMARKNSIVSSFQGGVAALFKKNGVKHFKGTGSFSSANRIAIAQGSSVQEITARHVIIATGSEPIPLPFLPFDEKRIVSSTGVLALPSIPKRLLVIGAGVIGVELGSVYKRLGAEVSFVEFMDRICPTLDESLSKELHHQLKAQGMQFQLSSKVTGAKIHEREIVLKVALPDHSTQDMSADVVLVCIGRRPYSSSLGLERIGVSLTPQGMIPIDSEFRTKISHIFAIGDIVDGPMLAHKAEEEGTAAAEIIAGGRPKICYAAIPNIVYTYPEVASVGLTEAQAKQYGLKMKKGTFPFKANSRAKCTGEEVGFVSVYCEEQTKKIIGVHIIGAHASELIAEGALAMEQQLTLDDIIATPHAHPTLCEAVREAALDVERRAINK